MAEKITFDAYVREKGLITIPIETRDKAGIEAGDLLAIEARVVKKAKAGERHEGGINKTMFNV